jgi:predicted nicotinamide N-methyase
LEQRIRRRGYRTLVQQMEFGNLELGFTRIMDPDDVLDKVAAEEDRLERTSGKRVPEDQLRLPYWAELWDSARALAQWLVRTWGSDPPATVLDLGCGMGLSGAVAAGLGARVIFADLEPDALLFARLNSREWADRVTTRRLDWRVDRLGERFDLILGADILYERKQWDYLEPFWREHLKADGRVLLGEPGRQTGDLFIPWILQRGWTLMQHEEPVVTRPQPVRLFELTAPKKARTE